MMRGAGDTLALDARIGGNVGGGVQVQLVSVAVAGVVAVARCRVQRRVRLLLLLVMRLRWHISMLLQPQGLLLLLPELWMRPDVGCISH